MSLTDFGGDGGCGDGGYGSESESGCGDGGYGFGGDDAADGGVPDHYG